MTEGEPSRPHGSGPRFGFACTSIGALTAVCILAWSVVLRIGLAGYMREHSGASAIGWAAGLIGAGVATGTFFLARARRHRKGFLLLLSAVLVVLLELPASTVVPGGVTRGEFGLTVVGHFRSPRST